MNTLYIYAVDETWIQLDSDNAGTLQEISEFFTFEVPGAKFTPAYKNKMWDGRIRLVNMTGRIYKGLLPYIEDYCKERGYSIVKDEKLKPIEYIFNIDEFIKSLNLIHEAYDFQSFALKEAIERNRCTLLSPTSSGKSLIIYCLVRFFMTRVKKKILICEPTVVLVNQMLTEFKLYAPDFPIADHIHKIYDGASKITDKKIVISTWQAVYEQKKEYFDLYDVIIVDETHTAKADSIKGMFEKAINVIHRFGLTGTLNDTKVHRLVIEGLTGPAIQVAKTKELMDRKIISELIIKCIILKYTSLVRIANKKMAYEDEVDFIVNYQPRNEFIAKLASAVPNNENVLILTDYHDKKPHIDLIKKELEKITNKEILIVTGFTDADEKERIRLYMNDHDGVILLATSVFFTGVSINNIQHLIFGTNSKSVIKLLQSIGRGLRRDGKKNKVNAYDIVDDFGFGNKKNYLTQHFLQRIRIYISEKFSWKTKNINIK